MSPAAIRPLTAILWGRILSVAEYFETMDYGPAPESDAEVRASLLTHKSSFGHFIGGVFVDGAKQMDTNEPAYGQASGKDRLGEIDPAGETIKLATLGLRGVAANILWDRANEAKKTEDWTGFKAVLDQLSKLSAQLRLRLAISSLERVLQHLRGMGRLPRPLFLGQGGHQVSAPRHSLQPNGPSSGLRHRLVHGSQKIGIADERVQFRRLFREDDDTEFPDHRLRPFNRRDNWLVGQEYFEQAVSLVDDRGASIRTMNPLTYFCQPAMCQINFANGLEEDGIFEEKAKVAWEEAVRRWDDYGNRELPATEGFMERLNEQELLTERAAKTAAELDALAPGERKSGRRRSPSCPPRNGNRSARNRKARKSTCGRWPSRTS